MPALHLRNVRIVNPGRGIVSGDVLVENGRIAAVGNLPVATLARLRASEGGVTTVEGAGRQLTPGLIDLHTHGVMHSLYEAGADGVREAARVLGRFGVTTVLPTIVPQMKDGWEARLASVADAIPSVTSVQVPGIHLEGPFMAVGGAACPTLPGDLNLLERLLAACRGRVAAMSLSPDAPNILPVIRRLREERIPVFLTHTRATAEQTEAALAAGATHATHFYDVFYAPAETDPGVRPVGAVESILAERAATVDFIADGVHVHPTAIRAAVAAKGFAGVALITDSNIGAGLPPGVYETPWGFPVRVREGDGARHATKATLAGSALTMDRGMANLFRWLTLPPEQIWAMGTLNPARILGLTRKGRLEPGADADLVLWDNDLRPAQTWVLGNSTYEKAAS